MRILFSAVLLLSVPSLAQTSVPPVKVKADTDSGYQQEIQEKAKRRIYPGGQDETDLKVQLQLASPTRKVAPVVEDTSEPVSDD